MLNLHNFKIEIQTGSLERHCLFDCDPKIILKTCFIKSVGKGAKTNDPKTDTHRRVSEFRVNFLEAMAIAILHIVLKFMASRHHTFHIN